MRNRTTAVMGEQLTQAYLKSGMSPEAFMQYLNETREVHDIESQGEYHSFTIIKDGAVYDFYFSSSYNEWSCKC